MKDEKDRFKIKSKPADASARSSRSGRAGRKERSSGKKAPIPLRLLAWTAMVALFFSVGYGGTSLVLRIMGKNKVIVQEDVASSSEEAESILQSKANVDGRIVSFSMYTVSSGNIERREVKISSGVMEDDIRRVLSRLIKALTGEKMFTEGVELKHAFRSGDLLYLDFNGAFLRSLRKMSGDSAVLLMTGIVRTIVENFMPVTKVRFLIDGQIIQKAGEINLAVPWQLKTS